jgi:hypothetical protein
MLEFSVLGANMDLDLDLDPGVIGSMLCDTNALYLCSLCNTILLVLSRAVRN